MTQKFSLLFIVVCVIYSSVFNLAHADAMSDVYDKVHSSIYQLYAIDKDKQTVIALGSAVAVTSHYLATNCHVALAGNFLIAKVGNDPYLARLCYFNQENDLCIIDVVGAELQPVKIRATKTVHAGEVVYAVAKLRGRDKVITHGVVTKIISDVDYPILQSDAQTTFGSSGGGLFDKDANLIGLTTRGIPGTDIGYSIPTELILEVIDPKKMPKCMVPG